MLASQGTSDPVEFRILGPLELLRGGRRVDLRGPRQRALLAMLLLHANEVVASDRLIEGLWGEQPPETAASALRVHVAELRKALDGGSRDRLLVTRSPGYVLSIDPAHIDLQRFERLVEQGTSALAAGRSADAAHALREALGLWRGPPLDDLAYEPFAQHAIPRLEELRVAAIEKRIDAELALGKHADLIGELETLIREYPLRERLRGQLILALYRSGRQADALEVYRQTRRTLVEELGLDPSPALQRLEKSILRQDPSLEASAGEAPADVSENEARPLTALVADISSAAPGDADDGDGDELPREVLQVMLEAVFGHGGRIETFPRRHLVALFGAPTASEDDPERALLAALAISERVRELGMEATVGVSTGELQRGVVNLAERLSKHAPPAAVTTSAATHRLTRLSFEFSPVKLNVGGATPTPISAYEVRRPLARPQKARGIEGLRADLQGRENELAELGTIIAAALDGKGQMVAIVGEAGVGKSRLVAELREASVESSTDVRWLEGRCRASGSATSYLPYVEIFSDYFAWVPEDDEREREKRIVSAALELVRVGHLAADRVEEIVSVLANLLSVRLSHGDDPLSNVAPEQLRNRTFAAVKDFFVALAAERPLVLVLEDFHWADALSLDLTVLLMDVVPSTRIVLVCVLRPDPVHRRRRLTTLAREKCGDAYHEIELQELSPEDSRELLHALLPIENPSRRVEELILSASQGNPFVLEEILQSLIDSGNVYRANGSWRLGAEIESLTVPTSVQAVIASRVDRLDRDVREILQTGAVLGRSFRRRLLAHLVGDDDDFERALWELESRGLIYEDRVLPEEECSFKHVLTQEAIYRTVPESHRRALHERAGRALERLYAESLNEHYEQLAHHFERSGSTQKAVDYLYRAGEKSRRLYLNVDAIDYFRRALAWLGEIGRDARREWRSQFAADIHERLGDVLDLTGTHAEANASHESALALVPEVDVLRRARLHRKIAESYHVQRRVGEAHAALDEAEAALGETAAAPADDWWEERAQIELDRLWLQYFFGSNETLLDSVGRTRKLIEGHGTPSQRASVFELLALAGVRRARFTADEETVAYSRCAVAAAEESADVGAIALARFELGFCLLWAWKPEEASAELGRALALAERIGDVTLQARCLAYLTLAARRQRAVSDVQSLAARTLAVAEAGQMLEYVAQAKANLAWAALREGNLAVAEREAKAAWTVWGRIPYSGYPVIAWISLWPVIAVALGQGRLEEALEHVRSLLDPARQPMPDDLRNALTSALASQDRDDADAAGELLESATRLAGSYGYL